MLPIRRILHPTDFSDHSQAAFTLACALARDFSAEMVICHVFPPPVAPVVDGMVVDIPRLDLDPTRARLERMTADDPNVRVIHKLVIGEAAEEILRTAEEDQVDLIVMGTHGRGGLSRLLMGSVAEAVMRKAVCPVLTVRSPGPAAKREPAEEVHLVTS